MAAYPASRNAANSCSPRSRKATNQSSRWGRSVTAIPGPDGSVYVTDDHAGLIYRITPAG